MAGSSLLTLLDDIATLLDDVATLTKAATTKTAGVLGDDLALNAQQVTGVRAERELPVVLAVARGSLVNKAVLVPAALAISALAPWLVTPLLMLGGLYLCYEGFEKLAHHVLHGRGDATAQHAEWVQAVVDPSVDLVAFERDRIRGAVRTDFILSAEIIVITLGVVAGATLSQQIAVLTGVALVMTIGVYGLVAAIVKLDDLGLYLGHSRSAVARSVGSLLLAAAPLLMKALSVLGTAAMFFVGGGILVHGVHALHAVVETLEHCCAGLPVVAPVLAFVLPLAVNAVAGMLAGALTLLLMKAIGRLRKAAVRPD